MIQKIATSVAEALIGIDMVVALGPDDPDAQDAAAESRRILEGLGAGPYLARLDGLLAATPPRATRPVRDDAVTQEA
jgi:hypothetical protein